MARVQRGDVHALALPDEVSETILRGAAESSVVQQFAKARSMSGQVQQITEAEVTGANVFWVGEGARKQTDAPAMAGATWTMNAAELAVIIPLDENVAEDATVDLFELYKPAIETAIARKLDAAALFGTDKPLAWGTLGTDINADCTAAGSVYEEDGTPTDVELLNLIAGTGAATPDGALQSIETDEYEATGIVGYTRFKARLRGLKDADNRYIFGDAVSAGVPGTLFGIPIAFTKSQVWTPALAHMIMGDWNQAIVGTRAGIRYKVFDQGVITDGGGNVVYSLMENDMIALRVTARYGFKVIADDTADGQTVGSGDPYPFAIVAPEIP